VADLRYRRKARERVSVERFGLPRRLVPRSVLIADDLHRHDNAVAAELVSRGYAVVEFSVGARCEFDRPRQVIVPPSRDRKPSTNSSISWTTIGISQSVTSSLLPTTAEAGTARFQCRVLGTRRPVNFQPHLFYQGKEVGKIMYQGDEVGRDRGKRIVFLACRAFDKLIENPEKLSLQNSRSVL
jgi:hypothetical protein